MKNVSPFQFINPEIENLEFYSNTDFDKDTVELSASIKTKIEETSENIAKVYLNVVIGAKDKEYPFYIDVTISSVFKWGEDTENVDDLLKINAPTLLLSYVRPMISNITGWSKYPPYNMPFIDMAGE